MDITTTLAIGAVLAALYAWLSVGLGGIFARFEVARGAAWIPVRRHAQVARLSGQPTAPVWLARTLAAVCWPLLWLVVLLRAADAVAGSRGIVTLAVALAVCGLLGTGIGWAAWVAGAGGIEMRLGMGRRLGWLAALLPPLWAMIVGVQPARAVVVDSHVPDERAGNAPAEPDDATVAIPRVESPPQTADNAGEPASDTVSMPEQREEVMTTEEHDITGQVPRSYSPYDAPLTPVPLPDPPSPWGLDDDDDATFFAKRRRARWVLRVIGAEDYDLEDITTIGREGVRPIPGVLPIVDDTRTMSKLHARLRREADNWFVTDLGSTNGTFVREEGGNEYEVKAQTEAKVVGTLLLGDLEAVIVDQRELEQ